MKVLLPTRELRNPYAREFPACGSSGQAIAPQLPVGRKILSITVIALARIMRSPAERRRHNVPWKRLRVVDILGDYFEDRS